MRNNMLCVIDKAHEIFNKHEKCGSFEFYGEISNMTFELFPFKYLMEIC